MNEIRLIYFGIAEDIQKHLLFLLNVLEVRPAEGGHCGFYVLEIRFGQESLRPISLDVMDENAADILLFRYLSDNEKAQLQKVAVPKRYFILLHNMLSLEYVTQELITENGSQFNFVVEMGISDQIKPFNYVRKHVQTNNFFRISRIENKKSEGVAGGTGFQMPLFLLAFFKMLFSPISEFKRLSILAKYSNLRVIDRFLELLLFINFVFKAVIVKTFHVLGIRIFYRSNFLAGVVKVLSIKSVYFFRHIGLMSVYKIYGVLVDGLSLVGRVKDRFVLTVYYNFLHRMYFKTFHVLYHNFLKKIWDVFLYKIVFVIFYKIILEKIFYEVILERVFYRGILWAYHNVFKKIFDVVVYKLLFPLFYNVILRVYLDYIKKVFDFFMYNLLVPFFHKVLMAFYYKIVLAFFHKVLMAFYYKIVLAFFHKVLMAFYYKIVLTFYHKVIMAAYHNVFKKIWNFFWYRIVYFLFFDLIMGCYHRILKPAFSLFWFQGVFYCYYRGLLPTLNFLRLNVYLVVRYKFSHYVVMAYYKTYGLVFDFCTLSYRFTKLVLLYPVFKVYWFGKFQYEKRLKKFLL